MKLNIFQTTMFIIVSLILGQENIQIFNLNPFETINIEKLPSACVCIKMSDEIEKEEFFYITLNSNESNASINETLSYNYTNLCQNNSCNDFQFYSNKECNLSKNENGFSYQYNFEKKDEKYLLIRYYQFIGNNLKVEYTKNDLKMKVIGILFIYVGSISLFTIIVLTILKYCWINKLRNKNEENNNFIAPLFPKENDKEIELIKK